MYTISQWKRIDNESNHLRYLGDWQEKTLQDAIDAIHTMKVSGRECTFAIENENGTIVDVIVM